jgi:benzoyl-CoA reductase/2-hydroxyglutaryl-CoA dehydratase subunit BcrC/BadD/HgdB
MARKTKGLDRIFEEISLIEMFIKFTEENPDDLSHLVLPQARFMLEAHRKTVDCVEQGEPFLAGWYTSAPEIYNAMDLHWYSVPAGAFGMGGLEPPKFKEDLEGIDQMMIPSDICTLLRLVMYFVEAELVPPPTAFIAAVTPCDGMAGVHEAIRNHPDWSDVPMFVPDPPYFEDERSVNYFAEELRRMVPFIQEHTGHEMDPARLREVVEESNKQYALWHEHNELRRSVPCPHGAGLGMGAFGIAQGLQCGRPEGTAWLQELVADAEKRIVENRPAIGNEKLRLVWFDLQPVWFGDLTPWFEEEWGATVVHTFFSHSPYTQIDTSSEETIFRGLAKRNLLDTPMIRQARGTVEVFSQDLTRIVNDFKIDCVIWPGHMGHKDGAAALPIVKQTCREIGVPLLEIGLDTFDRSYTPLDEMKNKISQFFTAMGIG